MEFIKKSANSWPQKLFAMAGTMRSVARPYKSYFGHHYPDNAPHQNTALSSLFAGFDANNLHAMKFPQLTGYPSVISGNTDKPSIKSVNDQFTVLNCYNETPDTKTFRLARTLGGAIDYLPGQYVTLTAVIAGKEYKRSYSIASTPTRQGVLEMTVKRDSHGGAVSNWLNDHVKAGDSLHLKGPFGKFTCAKATPKKILFLAAGSGVVPMMSMLRWLADTELQADVILLLSFRDAQNIIYRRELELHASCHRNFKLHITLTREPKKKSRWRKLKGRIDKKKLAALIPDLPERAVYLCGPELFMAECRRYMLELGHPENHLFSESFYVDSPSNGFQQGNPNHAPKPGISGNYQIQFVRSRISIITDGQASLLQLTEQAGIQLSHECRSGSCGECMVKCLEGKAVMSEQAEIDDIDRNQGWLYACCAYPVSHLLLDI